MLSFHFRRQTNTKRIGGVEHNGEPYTLGLCFVSLYYSARTRYYVLNYWILITLRKSSSIGRLGRFRLFDGYRGNPGGRDWTCRIIVWTDYRETDLTTYPRSTGRNNTRISCAEFHTENTFSRGAHSQAIRQTMDLYRPYNATAFVVDPYTLDFSNDRVVRL